ncbi:MAG TPA: CvpA family protein, partial [Candidatus Saccharimonadales bacterium]|nr:CvpA family protein [Candidatus Saccharimonadales bacterium]
MNWLDLIIALLLVAAFFRGMQAGFVQQFFSTLGVVVGIVFGAWIQGYLIGLAHSAQSKSLLALMVILTSAILFMTLGEFIGLRLKNKLERIRLAKKVDQGFGCALALVSILAGVWFGSAIFNNVPA